MSPGEFRARLSAIFDHAPLSSFARRARLKPETVIEQMRRGSVPDRYVVVLELLEEIRRLQRTGVRTEDLAAAYRSGMTLDAMAKCFGMSVVTIAKRLDDAGVKRRSGRDDVKVDDVTADYMAGMSMQKIAAKHGISTSTVSKRLDRAGVSRRFGRPDVLTENLLADRKAGLSIEKIAAKHGISPATVKARLKAPAA